MTDVPKLPDLDDDGWLELDSINSDNQPLSPTPPGMPSHYKAYERSKLQIGDWRFFYVLNDQRSVKEDHWATRNGEAMPGQKGLQQFLRDFDPTEFEPETLANYVGMFMIRGHSRRSNSFEVLTDVGEYPAHSEQLAAPSSHVEGDQFVFQAWYMRTGGSRLQHIELTFTVDGELDVRDDDWIFDVN